MAQGTLKVNTEKILPIIKKWLYSEKDIFIRELVSNSCDALNKLRILQSEKEVQLSPNDSPCIDIAIDKNGKTIKITDNGIGMTAEEVEKYIAQLAFSGAEEFLEKYKNKGEDDQIIGHFGLGFYSAYMVADRVEIQTLSYKENSKGVFWSCDGSSNYTIEEGEKKDRGTEITLYIGKDHEEYLEEPKIRSILSHYCSFLPYPIYLNDKHINSKEPLWIKSPADCTEKEYLEFYSQLYPFEQDPIFWVHLNVDYPFHLKGILYFPKVHKRFDMTENRIKLFCNRVFVSDDCKGLLPDYLMVLRGTIDSTDIPLNVSRSYLQMDRTVKQVASHISKKIADRLALFYQNEREKFIAAWPEIELIIKLGVLQDDKFYEKSKEYLIWKTLSGNWMTLEDYLVGKNENPNKVFYTSDDHLGSHILQLYKNKGIEILFANSYLDTAVINYLETKNGNLRFQRIDGALDQSILDPSREKTLLDAEGKTESSKIAAFFDQALEKKELQIEAKSLASNELPAFLVLQEENRRLRDYLAISGQSYPNKLDEKRSFIVNTNSPLIQKIYHLREKNPKLADNLAQQVYELSLLSQKEFSPANLSSFIERSHKVLEELI
ncbi:MAG: molecular chaperone HtpG [Chlamydiae bacterium]|nr:molecular chaperone HtpG [Chlamydiota bacterium]